MTILINIIIFILILSVIVAIHEFGHFIFAKLMGVYVYEYAIGMGPRIFSFKPKKSETVYSLRAIPLGGFCSLAGEDTENDDDEEVPKNMRLQSKKPWQRFLIMFFGPGFNFLLAIIILFSIALFCGGTTYDPIINGVTKNTPAHEVGLEKGDRIVKIDNHKIKTIDDVSLYLTVADKTKGTTIKVEKAGTGKVEEYKIKPKKIVKDKKTGYVYGLSLKSEKTKGFVNARKYTFVKTNSLFRQMFVTIESLFTGKVSVNQLSGPVGIYSIVSEQAKSGFANLMYLMAYLSINVGFLNLLPIPAFDGGHILFILIELIRRKPVKPEVENTIHTVGLCLLMLLMIYVTINDIFRIV